MGGICLAYFLGGGDYLKVINGKKGKGVHTFDETAKISHEMEKKTSLSKRNDGVISNKKIRTVGNDKPPDKMSKIPRGAPSAVSQKAEHYSDKNKSISNSAISDNYSANKSPETPRGSPSVISQKSMLSSAANCL